MKKELNKIRITFFFSALLFFVASILILVGGLAEDIWYLALISIFVFLIGFAIFIFSLIYPIIYKINLEIERIEKCK